MYDQDSRTSQAMNLAIPEVTGLSWRKENEFISGIEKVTAQQIQSAAKRYLIPDNLTIAILEPILKSGATVTKEKPMLRQLFIKISGLLCGLICLTATAQNIQHWQTPQGTPVYFVQSPDLPMVDVRVIFTAGSAYDQNQWGIASLTAAALNEGTKAHNADQIADALEQTGAQYECDTDRDVTILGLRSLSDSQYLTPALKMFNEIISQANFPDSALSRLKQQTLAAIRQEQQDPYEVAKDAFFSNLYPDHPYGHAILGKPSTVTAITRSQVQEFYQRFFNSQ